MKTLSLVLTVYSILSVSPALAGQGTKPAFSVFGDKRRFVEVKCTGSLPYSDGVTAKLYASDNNAKSFDGQIQLSEVSELQLSVSSKRVEETLMVAYSADEQPKLTRSTYDGLSVRLRRGNLDITCALNNGKQTSPVLSRDYNDFEGELKKQTLEEAREWKLVEPSEAAPEAGESRAEETVEILSAD